MYHLSIVTPEKVIFDGQVESMIAPGTIGYLEILSHHAPIVTTLQAGELTIKTGDTKQYYAISGGFLEVSQNQATVLGEAIEKAEEIDTNRAEATIEWAQRHIEFPTTDVDPLHAKKILSRAQNRLKIHKKHFKS